MIKPLSEGNLLITVHRWTAWSKRNALHLYTSTSNRSREPEGQEHIRKIEFLLAERKYSLAYSQTLSPPVQESGYARLFRTSSNSEPSFIATTLLFCIMSVVVSMHETDILQDVRCIRDWWLLRFSLGIRLLGGLTGTCWVKQQRRNKRSSNCLRPSLRGASKLIFRKMWR